MALQEIHLSLASRSLIHQLIGQLPKADVKEARAAKSIRKSLELKQAIKDIAKLDRVREKEIEEWDSEEVPPGRYGWDELIETRTKKFTIDDAHVAWLKDKVEDRDWTQVNANGQQLTIAVSIEQLVAIADLADSLLDAKLMEKRNEAK